MLMRIIKYHQHKLSVFLLFTTFFLVSCGGSLDGKSLVLFPFFPSADDSLNLSERIDVKYTLNDIIPYWVTGVGITKVQSLSSDGTLYRGIYRKMDGFYECVAASGEGKCIVTANDGVVGQGVLQFTSTKKEETIGDPDYLTFGVWLEETLAFETLSSTIVVNAFAEGANPFNKEKFAHLPKTAAYEGKATGIYVNRPTAGVGMSSDVGEFTAGVSLKANFENRRVSGVINNFQGMPNSENFRLEINPVEKVKANIDNTKSGLPFNVDTSGSTDDGHLLSGHLNGKFYGGGDALSSVVGTFNAHSGMANGNGAYFGIIGAFGAKKQ